jgi:signal transduction histidine kinase
MTDSQNNILVVDDELSFARLMERMLQDHGYRCSYVTSGAEALCRLRQDVYDLVITDINMPEMDGLELIEKMHLEFPEIVSLVTTGVNDREVALKALEMGAYGYMLKPCDEFEVMIHLENALRRAKLEKINLSYQQELQAQVAERTAELEETNKMLLQQEKLASIGQLAAGIAHEIKTPTGYVASNIGTLKKYQERQIEYLAALEEVLAGISAPEQKAQLKSLARQLKMDLILEDAVDLVDNCIEGTDRIKSIIQGLKDFSRQDQAKEESLDLNQIIEDSLLLVNNELKYKAEVHVRKEELPAIKGYRQRLGQVFINLLVNAAHSIKEQGIISVATQLEGELVIAKVTDSGCGIAPEQLEKIFEPFYTTKEIGVGTGLGLSIIKDIIEEHQGTISVESTVDEGTVFTLSFPVTA